MKCLDRFIREMRKFLNLLFRNYDRVWLSRRRKLDSRHMFSAILAHVLNKDSSNSRLMSNQLDFLSDGSFQEFSASSFSKARRRFPFEFFVDLSQWVYRYHQIPQQKRWFGYSVFALDSTIFTVPKELEEDGFHGLNNTDSYYPQAMLTAMYDLQMGMIYDSVVSQHKDERSNAYQLFQGLPSDSLVICDRGFPSFEFFYEAEKVKIDLLTRIGIDAAPEELRDFIHSDNDDEILTLTPSIPTERKSIRRGYIPHPIEVRAVKYKVKGSAFVVITTITDPALTKNDIRKLYWTRWDIEEQFKLSKIGLKLETFKAKHLEGVLQEVWATQVLSAMCRALSLCLDSERSKKNERKDYSQIGVAKVLRTSLLRGLFCRNSRIADFITRLKNGLMKTLTTFRPGRHYPRRSWQSLNQWSLKAEGVSC